MALIIDWIDASGVPISEQERNVESLFNRVNLVDTPEVRKVLRLIEKAEYNDETTFIDRYGSKLHTMYLSMGCKAALAVLLGRWDKWVSLIEVGTDATYVILSVCNSNKVLIRDEIDRFMAYSSTVDIEYDGKTFASIEELNSYLVECGL